MLRWAIALIPPPRARGSPAVPAKNKQTGLRLVLSDQPDGWFGPPKVGRGPHAAEQQPHTTPHGQIHQVQASVW